MLLVFQHSLTSSQIAARKATLPAEAYLGAKLSAPVDISSSFDAARPEWSFRALYHMTKLPVFSRIGMFYAIFVVPPLLVICFLAAPILGRSKILHYVVVFATFVFFVVFCYFTYRSYWSDYSPESEHSLEFKAGVADAKRSADRAVELAFAPAGIPRTGALTLVKNDPFLVGPKLFAQHCASCHNFKAKTPDAFNPDYVEIECSEPTAPNLYGAHTVDWIRGFTNEATLAEDDCFGKTAFAEKGSMVGFMKGRVAGGLFLDGGAFMLNGNGLIAKVIAADGSPAFDLLESAFEDFCTDEENIAILESVLNEDGDLDDETVEAAQIGYINKLKELVKDKFADDEFIAELDPQLPASVLTTLEKVLLDMFDDDVYRELLLDEDNVELVKDEDYDEFLADSYLATLNGSDEPIPPEDQKVENQEAFKAKVIEMIKESDPVQKEAREKAEAKKKAVDDIVKYLQRKDKDNTPKRIETMTARYNELVELIGEEEAKAYLPVLEAAKEDCEKNIKPKLEAERLAREAKKAEKKAAKKAAKKDASKKA